MSVTTLKGYRRQVLMRVPYSASARAKSSEVSQKLRRGLAGNMNDHVAAATPRDRCTANVRPDATQLRHPSDVHDAEPAGTPSVNRGSVAHQRIWPPSRKLSPSRRHRASVKHLQGYHEPPHSRSSTSGSGRMDVTRPKL